MVGIEVTYEGALRCRATHGPSRTALLTDAPADNHGRAQSFSPTDLMATALGTCVLTVMGIVAERHGLDLAGARASVEKEMVADPRRRIARLRTVVRVPVDPGEEGRKRLVAAGQHCPVHNSLAECVEVPIEFRWGAAAAD